MYEIERGKTSTTKHKTNMFDIRFERMMEGLLLHVHVERVCTGYSNDVAECVL